jgi:hypothetical protein
VWTKAWDDAVVEPAPLRNAAKVAVLTTGGAIGVGLGTASMRMLPTPETEERLEAQGISTMSGLEATARFAPMPFVLAAAVGTGIGRRSGTAAWTTASLGAAAMLASSAQSTMGDAEESAVADKLRALGLTSVLAAGAYAVGAVNEVPLVGGRHRACDGRLRRQPARGDSSQHGIPRRMIRD